MNASTNRRHSGTTGRGGGYVFEVCLISKHCIRALDGSPKPSCHAGSTDHFSSFKRRRSPPPTRPGRSNAKWAPLPAVLSSRWTRSRSSSSRAVPAELTPRSSPCSLVARSFAKRRPTKFEARPVNRSAACRPVTGRRTYVCISTIRQPSTSESGPRAAHPMQCSRRRSMNCGH